MSATRAPNGGAPGIRHETDGDGRTAAIRPERTAVPVLRPLSGLRGGEGCHRLPVRAQRRQLEYETSTSIASAALGEQRAAMELREMASDRQPEPEATMAAATFALVKQLEDVR